MADDLGVRSPAHLYTLRSHPQYLFWTGVGGDGRQVLACGLSGVIARFDPAGHLAGVEERPELAADGEAEEWLEATGVRDGPIRVRRFAVPGHRTRIEDLPGHLEDFRRDPDHPTFTPDDRSTYPADIAEWLATGQFVYHADGADFFVSADGEVVAS